MKRTMSLGKSRAMGAGVVSLASILASIQPAAAQMAPAAAPAPNWGTTPGAIQWRPTSAPTPQQLPTIPANPPTPSVRKPGSQQRGTASSADSLLRKFLLTKPTLKPITLSNPHAGSGQQAQRILGLIGMLKVQMARASAERATLISAGHSATAAATAATGAPTGASSASAVSSTWARPLPATTAVATWRGASFAPPAHLSAESTMMARGSRAPGVFSHQLPQTAATSGPLPCQQSTPQVFSMNGAAPAGIVFTPDPQYNLYTFKGCHFGATPGQLTLIGRFKGNKVALRIVDWTDTSIIATLDPAMTGEPDEYNDVTLLLVRTDGQRAQFDGNTFYAVRASFEMQALSAAIRRLRSGSRCLRQPGRAQLPDRQ